MTPKQISTSLLALLFLSSGFVADTTAKLQVEVTGLENQAGSKIRVSVFSKNDFLKKPLQTKAASYSGQKARLSFDLPPGNYAVSTYQDLNNNSKLDRHFYGKPKEPFGFSNNVSPSIGPPDFNDCQFTLVNGTTTISIKLLN